MRSQPFKPSQRRPTQRSKRSCPLCKQAGRKEFNHFLSSCSHLPEDDPRFLAKVRQLAAYDEESDGDIADDIDSSPTIEPSAAAKTYSSNRRVQVTPSPYLDCYYHQHTMEITLDTGAETNMIRSSVVRAVDAPISKNNQRAFQADGKTPLKVVGETKMVFQHGKLSLVFAALVVDELDLDILGGVPFISSNDIAIRTSKRLVKLHWKMKHNSAIMLILQILCHM